MLVTSIRARAWTCATANTVIGVPCHRRVMLLKRVRWRARQMVMAWLSVPRRWRQMLLRGMLHVLLWPVMLIRLCEAPPMRPSASARIHLCRVERPANAWRNKTLEEERGHSHRQEGREVFQKFVTVTRVCV